MTATLRGSLLSLIVACSVPTAEASEGRLRFAEKAEAEGILYAIESDFRNAASRGSTLCFLPGDWNMSLLREYEYLVDVLTIEEGLPFKREIYGTDSQWPVAPEDPQAMSSFALEILHLKDSVLERPIPQDYIPPALQCLYGAAGTYKERLTMPLVSGKYAIASNWYGLFFLREQNEKWKVDLYQTFAVP